MVRFGSTACFRLCAAGFGLAARLGLCAALRFRVACVDAREGAARGAACTRGLYTGVAAGS